MTPASAQSSSPPSPDDSPIDLEALARQLWAIGDITRLRILMMLPTSPECQSCNKVSALAQRLGLSQPTVSNHLGRLRTLGIVRHQKLCRDVYYWINPEMAGQILEDLRLALKFQDCGEESS